MLCNDIHDKVLNSVQTWHPGFSALFHYTKFGMASRFWSLMFILDIYAICSQIMVCSRSNKRQSRGLALAGSPFTRLQARRPSE